MVGKRAFPDYTGELVRITMRVTPEVREFLMTEPGRHGKSQAEYLHIAFKKRGGWT